VLLAATVLGCGRAAEIDGSTAVGAPGGASGSPSASHFAVERVVSGLDRPVFVGAAPGDDAALWVLEQPGRILRLEEGSEPAVALDLSADVLTGAEQGLIGLAFHPGYASNRRLFLHWTDHQGSTRVAEFRARPDGRSIDPAPVRDLLTLPHPEENHYGGQLAFGPDRRLHLGLGDGGGAFDPQGTAQDPGKLLGKLLAVDVDAPEPEWRIVLVGLRNPWRFSFDPALAEIWVADVGQDQVEEINRVPLEPDEPPKNLGWSAFEGPHPVPGHELTGGGELIFPVATYGRQDGCAVIGGVVYVGTRLPELNRRYLYGDYCTGSLWSLRSLPDGQVDDITRERATVPQLTHIGLDGLGELVFASGAGAIYRATSAH
jgi:glucose/arabinose dehydrogenase